MAIEATLHMNKICFPMEMLIGRYEVEHLIDGGALVVGWQPKQAIEGLLVLVPEHVVAEELRDVDLEYSPDEVGGLYIFNRCSEMASKERCGDETAETRSRLRNSKPVPQSQLSLQDQQQLAPCE